jgi:hypothetical protein
LKKEIYEYGNKNSKKQTVSGTWIEGKMKENLP